ncbi:mitogen-activated protein kinase kinase 2-like isoform X1 [Iris pallida]|uniref:mitogen-activated protein kinase kinase n=1 Tax=Iris pallida TaxID=29817 RepID=A0AAX6HMH2_IRIPA|nr:mitogen-activated protein kinase kinase 2-like isoform X1 [Iris pallida]
MPAAAGNWNPLQSRLFQLTSTVYISTSRYSSTHPPRKRKEKRKILNGSSSSSSSSAMKTLSRRPAMRRAGTNPLLVVPLTHDASIEHFLTQSGTFKAGDLLVNKDGLRIVQHGQDGEPPLIKPLDNHLTLADMDTIKVIGKGSGGIVQLIRHKWTGQFFALKVIQMNIQENVRKQIAEELRINLASHSPYVVVCYQSFYDNGAISIVLEYMDGGSLGDFLGKVQTIPEPYLAAICKQASARGFNLSSP